MKTESTSYITIFHLYRKDGSELFLHPLDNASVILSLKDGLEVVGKYGEEPKISSLTAFRDALYAVVDSAVKSFVQDARFIPNLLVSAAIFMFVYFFMTFSVRDPVPMIDEALVALGVSIFVYFRRIRKDQKRPEAVELRKSLKEKIDSIEFSEDGFVKEVEGELHRYESVSPEKLLESLMVPGDSDFDVSDLDNARQLLAYLDKRFSGKFYRRQERYIDNYRRSDSDVKTLRTVGTLAGMGKIDLSLYMTYLRLKQKCREHV